MCLTANGELFTWGSNVCGQLGRTQGDGWGYPQLVPALMGMRMSQVKLRVTRHTSHVTRHTSHVARHTLRVTRHTSSDWLWRRLHRRPIRARRHIRMGQVTLNHIQNPKQKQPRNTPHALLTQLPAATLTASSAACHPAAKRSLLSRAPSPNSSTSPSRSCRVAPPPLLPCARAGTATRTCSRRCSVRLAAAAPGRRYRVQAHQCGWVTCRIGRSGF